MNWSKLPKEKRNQLIMVVLLAIMAVSGLGFGLIRFQYNKLAGLAEQKASAEQKLGKMRDAIKHAVQLETDVAAASQKLSEAEADVASGDLYSWFFNTIRQFKSAHRVEILQYGLVDGPKDMSLLPGFPYQQATLTVSGTAHFHDLGWFLADLENRFPHMRVLNLGLDLNASPMADDPETLSFRIDLVTLVKPNAS